MGKLFGTDGIRGVAFEYPLTVEMAERVGRAVAHLYKRPDHVPEIIVGKDTRISGDILEEALVAGIRSQGANAVLAGVIPTPGVAYLSSALQTDAGIVISASHNPFADNGIKVFGGKGLKLSAEEEVALEELLLAECLSSIPPAPQEAGRVSRLAEAGDRYIHFLKNSFLKTASIEGVRLVLDCANGAASIVAPKIFRELGAEVTAIFDKPDGKNINAGCGSQHPEMLAKMVLEKKAAAGFAFDGDSDRVIAVDEKGKVLTGDQILTVCAASLKKEGRLENNLVVRTVMSNIGMSVALRELGIASVITDVGDRAVLAEMQAKGAIIGGEDSGHIIFLHHHSTGDGIITALQVLAVMSREKKPLSELAGIMKVFPQALINVEVKERKNTDDVPEIARIIKDVEDELGKGGRVLVRYSGTQNLCRVMVEGPTTELTNKYCRQIADVVKATLS